MRSLQKARIRARIKEKARIGAGYEPTLVAFGMNRDAFEPALKTIFLFVEVIACVDVIVVVAAKVVFN